MRQPEPDWAVARPCLTKDCPHEVEKGVRHVRCRECRKAHSASKAADAQWLRRARARAERERRRGNADPDPQVRRRLRTPDWDQYGRPVPPVPRLTPTDAALLRDRLEALEQAVAEVRKALDPASSNYL